MPKRLLFVLIASAALLIPVAAKAASVPEALWPMYQYGPDHNAVFERKGFSTDWKFAAGGRINGGFAIVGNTLLVNTFAQELLAIDTRTGALLWRSPADDVLMSSPIVADGSVFVGSGHNGHMGAHGSMMYAYAPPDDPKEQVWGRPEGDDILAVDLKTGTKKWAYHTVGQNMPSPAYVDGTLVFGNGDLHAYGLRGTSGDLAWKLPLSGVSTMASATAHGNQVFLAVCHDNPFACETVSVDARTGAQLWHSPFGNSDCSPTYADGLVFVSGIESVTEPYEFGGYTIVTALDANTGKPAWSFKTKQAGPYTSIGSNERAVAGTYADGTYYQAITTSDKIMAFSAKTGKVKWCFKTIAPVKMSPVVRRDVLYFGDTAGVFYAVNAKTGKLIKSKLFKEPFTTAPPVIVGDTIFLANDTSIYAVTLE